MKKCFPDMLPAQELLLPSNTYIDFITKQRYYRFLEEKVDSFAISKSDEEMRPMVKTAVTWLISQTRNANDFSLINEENINFGTSYNLLGLKKYGIAVNIIGIFVNIGIYIIHFKNSISFNISYSNIIFSAIIYSMFLLLWMFIVTQKLVIICGYKYARALLSACDSPLLK